MSICRSVISASSDYLDHLCSESRALEIRRHLDECPACSSQIEELAHSRRALRRMPQRPVPADLAVRLRVTASKERARQISRSRWRDTFRLWAANTGKPMALPMAGGLASACFLFSAIMPSFAKPPALPSNDAPPAWYQSAELSDLGPFGFEVEFVTLYVRLDEQGRMIDYSVPPSEAMLLHDPQLRRSIENSLLFMRFKPAEFFGQPTTGRLRITLRRSQMDVKG